MNLVTIISEWENNALPNDILKLEAYKAEIDKCELSTFEAWRTATDKTMSTMLVNEQLLYADVSNRIQKAISDIKHQQIISQIKNGKSILDYKFQY